ncbi:hypothetical protein CMI37_32515 [Candidatus Pacearchaeota archaeon]|nr:hypothetical protein [Candidatus Pacearchaeota archaeon]|tara:strand:- start:20605 stop:22185 length:1581 start_codon:yes stop_codon:yes gene_type:complete
MEKLEKEALITKLQLIATENISAQDFQPSIVKLNDPYPFRDIKQLVQKEFEEKDRILFVINKNKTIRGKVTNKVNEYLNKISLIKLIEQKIGSGEDEVIIKSLKFFNEKIDRRHKILTTFDYDFYIYKMISEEREYLLFSIEPLDLIEYTIEGMEIEIGDMADIGNYTRINLQLPIIFVNNAKERVMKFTNTKDLFKILPKFNEEELLSYIFSGPDGTYFPHPKYFERLIISFLFSTKYDSSPYPMHLLIIGPQGSGKSKVMECLHWKFDENNEITDGSCSTMKSLIPSFRSTTSIQTGDLIKSNRICCVDEFLRILVRIPVEEREPQLAALNPLLEHKIRNFGSGNYSFKGKMTAKLITASNPVYGTSDMTRLTNKIDKSFLSRLIVFYQNRKHFNFVAEKDETELEKTTLNLDRDLFISIYDYMNNFKSKFDKEEVNSIFDEGLFKLGEDMEENPFVDIRSIYLARYKHHLFCLIDGLVKLRCLCEKDESFEANEQDYMNCREIWSRIISNMEIRLKNIMKEEI